MWTNTLREHRKKHRTDFGRFGRQSKEAVPTAVVSISYGVPFYDYKGRLAWFGLAKAHIGLYLRPPVVEEHKNELEDYETTKSAVRFPLDKKIPVPLIKKLVKDRMKKNEAKE